tara:strand:+ start:9825 stop:10289 length:465 start_codon:yes stop_codon:yes gene_type:complete
MGGFTAAGIAVDTVTATQQAPLGFELTQEYGQAGLRVWVYIQMTGGAAAAGDVIGRVPAATYLGVAGAATTTKLSTLGVAQHAIPNASFGFVLKSGQGNIKASAGVTVGTDLETAAASSVINFAGGAGTSHRVIGSSLVTAGAGVVAAMISCGV